MDRIRRGRDGGKASGAAQRPARGRSESIAIGLVLALAALAMPCAASAHSARYVYEICDSALPGGGVPAGTHFVVNPGVAMSGGNSCASPGGSLSITETGQTSSTFSFWDVPVAADPGGYVESLTISGAACGLGPGNDRAFVYEQGWPGSCTETQEIFHVNEGPTPFFSGAGFWIFMNCDGNYGPGCGAGPAIGAHYIAATEVDPSPPTISKLAGTLLAGGMIRGHRTIGAAAADEGGGLSSVQVLANGQPAAAAKQLGCDTVHAANRSVTGTVTTSPTPCPVATSGEWTVDTELPPFHEGINTVQVCAYDFATIGDPNSGCSPPQTIEVDNSCTDSPVPGGELLSAQFAASNAETETVPFGKGAKITGRLADNAGDPVAGATLCVKLATIGVDRRATTVGAVKTDASGEYTYEVAPGPNRKVVIGYRHDASQVAREVRFYAHTHPTLKASPSKLRNGDRVHFQGHLPGPRAGDRVVVLQAGIASSRRWITFRKATSGSRGAFRASYHFIATTRPTRYKFRAVVPEQSGYPWVAGHSKPVRVLVRG